MDLGFLALLNNFKNELLASFWLLFLQAALQVGGHGERLHQCREVMLLTYKSIPMQVDGEPCRLAPAMIRISLRNQANMVQKSKRRTSMPLLNEWVCPLPTFVNTGCGEEDAAHVHAWGLTVLRKEQKSRKLSISLVSLTFFLRVYRTVTTSPFRIHYSFTC